jgi:uncharacterized MAPEG superfamily protein
MTELSTELIVLALGCVLALVHIFATIRAKTHQDGREWNMGARDEALPPLSAVAARLERAQANFFETFPILIAAILMVEMTGANDAQTAGGAILWLAARALYLPVYWRGIPKLRSLVWLASLAGIVAILGALLF